MHRKFNDDIFARFLVIMKNAIYSNVHLERNIEGRLRGNTVMSSMMPASWKYYFWHNLGQSFHIWGQIEALFNISKWPPFLVCDKLFYRKLNIPER